MVLLDGGRVIDELIRGRIVVPVADAMQLAGRCAAELEETTQPEPSADLLLHPIGWIWVIYFQSRKSRTHFVLIHADGEVLAPEVARVVIRADKACGGPLHRLKPLNRHASAISKTDISRVRTAYFSFLAQECGEIQLAGLPADQEVGSHRLRLENLFVPLHVVPSNEAELPVALGEAATLGHTQGVQGSNVRRPVGKVLARKPRMALLGPPGSGKSTLLSELVTECLRSGNGLLLIDGLDEISDDGARVAFVAQLRTFLSTYPATATVVTSREAGFRIIGAALRTHCIHYTLADLDSDDIRRLTVAWHKEVIGAKQGVVTDAEELAEAIWENDRVRRLAQNPLLLTTLLLVKRWVGDLPRKRSLLYAKAIEVLLMTWNVEGHEALDPEEVIPQLEYIAFQMMKDGVQRVSSVQLKEILTRARKEMPEVLSWARMSVAEFVGRVELRSSILILSGHQIEAGCVQPTYEFRHLTFQEYLAARAIVYGHYPGHSDADSVASVLKPYLTGEAWTEVVPLASVLAGRKAQPIIDELIAACHRRQQQQPSGAVSFETPQITPEAVLEKCLIDEVQVPPDVLREALRCVAVTHDEFMPSPLELFGTKFGATFLEVAEEEFQKDANDPTEIGGKLSMMALANLGWVPGEPMSAQVVSEITRLVECNDPLSNWIGSLMIMEIAYSTSFFYNGEKPAPKKVVLGQVRGLAKLLEARGLEFLQSRFQYVRVSAAWALAWIGDADIWPELPDRRLLPALLRLWRDAGQLPFGYMYSWALAALPLLQRDSEPLRDVRADPGVLEFIQKCAEPAETSAWPGTFTLRAALVVGYYLRGPWNDAQLASLISKFSDPLGLRGDRNMKSISASLRTSAKQAPGPG